MSAIATCALRLSLSKPDGSERPRSPFDRLRVSAGGSSGLVRRLGTGANLGEGKG